METANTLLTFNKFMGIKGTRATYMGWVQYIKICCKVKEILDFSVASLIDKKYSRKVSKFFMAWFLLVSRLKERFKHKYLSSKQKPCNKAIKSWSGNLSMIPKKYFWFHWNCNQPRVEAENTGTFLKLLYLESCFFIRSLPYGS